MITNKTIKFLKDLKEHNSKEWMDSNRKDYEAAKQNYEDFVTALIAGLSAFEPAFKELQAKQCTFRLNRDVRFSENKAPYKSNFGAAFSKGGKKLPDAGYYFHLEPGSSFIGGGIWMPPADLLKAVRQEIDYDLPAFKKILDQKDFKKLYPKIDGEQLKTAPQGYSVDNPAIEYLRFKSFTVGHTVPDKNITGKDFVAEAVHSFKVMKPFIDFLNRSLE